jgi:uncharacterized membrane protein
MSLTQGLLILHLFSVTIALGIGFTNLVNMRVAKGQTGDIAKGLMMHRMAMLVYGDIFVAGILVTGGLLLWAIGGEAGLNAWFHVKMAAVLVWLICYVALRLTIRQIVKTGNMALASRIRIFAHVAITAATAALICAVMTFAT